MQMSCAALKNAGWIHFKQNTALQSNKMDESKPRGGKNQQNPHPRQGSENKVINLNHR